MVGHGRVRRPARKLFFAPGTHRLGTFLLRFNYIWPHSKRILKPSMPTSMLNRDPVQQTENWSGRMFFSHFASLSMLLLEACSSFGKRFPLLAAPIPIGSVPHNSGTRLKIRQTPYNLEASWPKG
jgi:hypothetical protein